MLVKSIDDSKVKTGEKLFEMLDSLVEKIEKENVVQVITDNKNNVLVGKLLKKKDLISIGLLVHCIDLMLEDNSKRS